MKAVARISWIIWRGNHRDNCCLHHNEYRDYENKPELDRYEAEGLDDEGEYR